MRYLTRSYVEWLGLSESVGYRMTAKTYWINNLESLPRIKESWVPGVVLNEIFYEREADGLAYSCDNNLWYTNL